MINMDTKTYDQVYYVETKETVNPVAIRPQIKGTGNQLKIEWEDNGSWGKSLKVQKLMIDYKPIQTFVDLPTKSPENIQIISEDNKSYTLKYLSLNLFNEMVKDRVARGTYFNSDEDVQNYYLNFGSY